MAKNFAEIFILLGLKKEGFDKGVKQTKGGLKGLNKDFDKLSKTAKAALTTGIVGGAVLAGKAIYDLGKRGADVIQTAESFEMLQEKLGLMPDLLDQLREASRGTVDDMTLMSGTATLLAGTSDELGKALGDATPKLMEIAKAANKLNPSLGTTAFMYQSIATGVKRAQPLILDNLGLTLKVGTANEKYAKSLGKTVDQLTAEEKAMAILNATLEAGDTMIDQVGGTTESAADEIAQLETNIANLKDELAKGLAPAVSAAAGFIAEQAKQTRIASDALDELGVALRSGLIDTEEFIEIKRLFTLELIDEKEVLERVAIAQEKYERTLGITEDTSEELRTKTLELVKVYGEAGAELRLGRRDTSAYTTEVRLAGEASEEATPLVAGLAEAFGKITEDIGGAKDQIKIYQQAVKAVADTEVKALRMKFLLELATWDLEHSTEELTAAEKKERTALLAGTLDRIDAIGRFEDLIVALDEGKISELEYIGVIADGKVTQKEYNRVLGITSDELHDVETGLGSTETAAGTLSGQLSTYTTPAVGDLFTSLESAAGQAGLLELGLIGASGEYSATFKVNVEPYTLPKMFGPPAPEGPYVPPKTGIIIPAEETEPWRGQRGLDFTVPQGYPNDSFYAPLALSSGEHVQVTPKGKGDSAKVIYMRGGDNVFIERSAAAAFLVEKQHQAEFDEIDKVI